MRRPYERHNPHYPKKTHPDQSFHLLSFKLLWLGVLPSSVNRARIQFAFEVAGASGQATACAYCPVGRYSAFSLGGSPVAKGWDERICVDPLQSYEHAGGAIEVKCVYPAVVNVIVERGLRKVIAPAGSPGIAAAEY